jgi:hypothetical protein
MIPRASIPAVNIAVLLAAVVVPSLFAQDNLHVISQQGTVSIMPLYQSWSVDSRFSEFSTGIGLYYPLSRTASLSVRTSHAATGGDPASISGLGDIQLGGSYHLERYHLVLGLGVNIPSGVKEMTQEEFETSVLFSNTLFDFRMPSFGQGLTLNPSAVWALPVNDNLVLGAGASYQYRGAFKPLKDYDDFDPGDEVLLTGGVDARLDETNTVSVDLIVSFYGSDKLGSEEVFAGGNKFVARGKWDKSIGTNEFAVDVLYRTLARDEVGVGGVLVPGAESLVPNQFEIFASYRFAIRRNTRMTLTAGGRFYQETPAALTGASLFVLGADPEFTVSEGIRVPVHLRIQAGSLKGGGTLFGLDLGAGVEIGL